MKLENHEMLIISGGSTAFSGTLLNSVAKLINTVLDVGRTIGTSIRMITTGKRC